MVKKTLTLSTPPRSTWLSRLTLFANKFLKVSLFLVFLFLELALGSRLISDVYEIAKIKLVKVLPVAADPVARFITKTDWNTRTIEFDSSPSKTYDNQVAKYIWRIDDGFSSMEGSRISHTFTHPGYYQILFSLVDTNGRSDQATCRVLFPPTELEQIVASEKVVENSLSGTQKQVNYRWVPKGIFFNYSKLDSTELGDLKSPYVETGCGFSNTAYNSPDLYEDITQKNLMLRRTLPRIGFLVLGMGVTLVIYLFLAKRLKVVSSHTGY